MWRWLARQAPHAFACNNAHCCSCSRVLRGASSLCTQECVAIGSDLRFGVQLQTITCDTPKVYKIHDKLYVGLAGLQTDAQTMYQKLMFR